MNCTFGVDRKKGSSDEEHGDSSGGSNESALASDRAAVRDPDFMDILDETPRRILPSFLLPDRLIAVRQQSEHKREAETQQFPSQLEVNRKRKAEPDPPNVRLARELENMTYQERNDILERIHGVALQNIGSVPIIEEKLMLIERCINRINKKKAYERARFISPCYVRNRMLRLMMLRAENFDEGRAARCLVNHLKLKLELFGIDQLVHPIRQVDLKSGMERALRLGYMQMLPQRDQSGRCVVVTVIDDRNLDVHWKSHIGMSMYLLFKALRDEDVQRRGFVFVCFLHSRGRLGTASLDMVKKFIMFLNSMPITTHGVHCCYDDEQMTSKLQQMQLALGSKYRQLVRGHKGSRSHCIQELARYGITKSSLPIDECGNLDVRGHIDRLDELQSDEPEMRVSPCQGMTPTIHDVLLGRGRPYQVFEGNLFLATVVERNRDQHANGARLAKIALVQTIMEWIHRIGGRFLKRIDENTEDAADGCCWVLAEETKSREKISHCFRSPVRTDLLEISEWEEYVSHEGERIVVPKLP